jgi:hypothetical protein
MQTKFFVIFLAATIFIGCNPSKQAFDSGGKQPGAIDRDKEMVELSGKRYSKNYASAGKRSSNR